MKSLWLSATVAGCLMATSSMATLEYWEPSIGFGYKYRHMPGQDHPEVKYQEILKKDYHSGEIYFGLKVHDYMGVEIGYERSTQQNNTYQFSAGELFGADANTANTVNTSLRMSNWRLNGNVFIPFKYRLAMVLQLGVNFMKPDFRNVTINQAGVVQTLEFNSKRRAVLYLGANVEWMFHELWGVRAGLVYEGSKKNSVSAKDEDNLLLPHRMFENGYLFNVSLFTRF